MSHVKERQEKICLNCNIPIHGRYCHQCGQQNIEPKESVWGLVTHFFYDITHFDGSFFSTVKYLLSKPGFLSAEYIKGRRASYLNPIRMYVFTSAFFFIVFFSVYDVNDITVNNRSSNGKSKDSVVTIRGVQEEALRYAKTKKDSLEIMNGFRYIPDSLDVARKDTAKKPRMRMNLGSRFYSSLTQYDSLQKALPPDERDNWFVRMMQKRQIVLNEKYGNDGTVLFKEWLNVFIHQFPKMFFVSLPLFALILRLLYIRRKQFYYVDHGIFTIHFYIFIFVLLLIAFGLGWLRTLTGWGIFGWIQAALWIYALIYMYKAMRNFYKQRRGKTILKFILLNILITLTIIFLFAVFFFFTVFQL